MHREAEVLELIKTIASSDPRVRAVLMNGSRVNGYVQPDSYQDYDIVFIVTDIGNFTSDHRWIDVFGKRTLLQMPDTMSIGEPSDNSFGYLMQFGKGFRIDLTLFSLQEVTKNCWPDTLTVCLLDKDGLFENLPQANDSGYWIKKPTQIEFSDVCNEFWWCSVTIIKALLRNEIVNATEIREVIVRPMFMNMLEWKVGIENNFSVAFGKGGKHMPKYVDDRVYQRVLSTYSDAQLENIWKSMLAMAGLFTELCDEVSQALNFAVNREEQRNAMKYLNERYL